MKRFLLLTICVLVTFTSLAQTMEYSVQLNSGVSVFRGPGAQTTGYPFGNQQEASYGAAFDVKAVTKSHLIFGLQGGYEILRSRINLYEIDVYLPVESFVANSYIEPPTGGHAILTDKFVNFNPYIGYRINLKKVSLDLSPGIDLAFGLRGHIKGQTLSNEGAIAAYNTAVPVDNDITIPKTDTRLRFDIKAGYQRFAIFAGYSHGLTAYINNQTAPNYYTYNTMAKADVVRIGISYCIK